MLGFFPSSVSLTQMTAILNQSLRMFYGFASDRCHFQLPDLSLACFTEKELAQCACRETVLPAPSIPLLTD